MSVLVTKATPVPSLTKRRAPADVWERWPERVRVIRTCFHCGTVYLNAGGAWVCEHYHEGL